jgi:hypothetical protein
VWQKEIGQRMPGKYWSEIQHAPCNIATNVDPLKSGQMSQVA